MVILSSATYLDVIKDFTALFVINEFDNYLFDYLPTDCKKALVLDGKFEVGSITLNLEDIFKIETTTSFKLDRDENDKEVEPTLEPIYTTGIGGPAAQNFGSPYHNRPTSALVRFKDRTCYQKT